MPAERPPPQDIDSFHARLAEVQASLPPRLRQCAAYLAENPGLIAVSTVAELAAGAEVQPSALMRFCQMLGFAGFSDMQRLFREAYAPERPDYATRLAALRLQGAGSPSALLAEFVDAGRKSLESLTSSVDSRHLDRAVAQLTAARIVHLAGMRRAFPVVSYLAYAFDKMAVPAFLHGGAGQLGQRHALGAGDALIAVSFAPYSAETVALADHAASLGAPVVAITDTMMSPLARPGVATLLVREVDFGAFRALAATLSLAMALAVAVGSGRAQGASQKG